MVLTLVRDRLGFLGRVGAVGVAGLVVAGCGSANGDSSAASVSGGSATVVTTTGIWEDIVAGITCDGAAGVDVVSLVPGRADPHSYEPSIADRETIDGAGLVVANGAGLEESISSLLDAVDDERLVEVAELDGVEVRRASERDHDEDGDEDPHLWLDPTVVAAAVGPLADRIVEATGADRAAIDECAAAYGDQLVRLDDEIARVVEQIPAGRRVLVTNHDAYGYFADRYGFEVIGTVIPSTSTLAETNAADLADLAAVIEDEAVPAIFVDADHDTAEADRLAASLDVEVVRLRTDTLDEGQSYLDLLRVDAAAVAEALGG